MIGFNGYGTALKPAHEPIILAMKPTEGTFAENALAHGVAGLNVDGGRITFRSDADRWKPEHHRSSTSPHPMEWGSDNGGRESDPGTGRWPANVLLSHHEDCREVTEASREWDHVNGGPVLKVGEPTWECHPECPVRMLDEQSGERGGGFGVSGGDPDGAIYGKGFPRGDRRVVGFGDSGGASRFFYTAKASRSEREAGLEGFEARSGRPAGGRASGRSIIDGEWRETGSAPRPARNVHPTVKPLALCEYLARLILPPKRDTPRRLLVPFSGSGSEMIGALLAGWDEVVGIEMEPEYVAIAEARLAYWTQKGSLQKDKPTQREATAKAEEGAQEPLF